MGLLVREYEELEAIQKKLANNTATSSEIHRFLALMDRSGNEEEVLSYTKNIGFDSMDEFKTGLNNKAKNEDLIRGLAVVGGAILVAWLLTKK